MFNVLAIGAHPDDIEFGCGGTLAKFKKLGCEIIYVITTNGGNWKCKDEKVRIAEQKMACKKLEIKKVYWLNIEDGNVRTESKVIDEIERIVLQNKINIVFSNYPKDSHQDHRELANIVKSGCRFCDNIFYYETLSSSTFEPNMYVDISKEINLKGEMLNMFETQILKYSKRNMNYLELARVKNKLHGLKSSYEYAEGFFIERMKFDSIYYRILSAVNDLSYCAISVEE